MTDEKKIENEDVSLPPEDVQPADSWQEELPPEDDFQGQEEDIPEDLIEDVLPADESVPGQTAGRSGKGVLIVILLVGAVLVGGLAYFQFSGSKNEGERLIPISSQLSVREIKESAQKIKADPKMKEAAAAASVEAQGKVDMNALFHQAQEQAAAATQSGAALPLKDGQAPAPTEKPGAVDKMSVVVSALPAETTTPLPPPSLTAVDAPKVEKIETVPVRKEDVQALMASQSETAKKEGGTSVPADARVKALEGQIEGLKTDLSKTAEMNAQLTARLEALQKTESAVGEAEALKKRVAELESKLAAAGARKETARTQVSDPLALSHEEVVVEKPVKVAVKKTAKKAAPKKKSAESKSAQAASAWVLRAATPEAAWVSEGQGGQELRRVAVGESLSGLGKIKEIRQVGDRWELIGDKGSVR